jgi:hypothetical protein
MTLTANPLHQLLTEFNQRTFTVNEMATEPFTKFMLSRGVTLRTIAPDEPRVYLKQSTSHQMDDGEEHYGESRFACIIPPVKMKFKQKPEYALEGDYALYTHGVKKVRSENAKIARQLMRDTFGMQNLEYYGGSAGIAPFWSIKQTQFIATAENAMSYPPKDEQCFDVFAKFPVRLKPTKIPVMDK